MDANALNTVQAKDTPFGENNCIIKRFVYTYFCIYVTPKVHQTFSPTLLKYYVENEILFETWK